MMSSWFALANIPKSWPAEPALSETQRVQKSNWESASSPTSFTFVLGVTASTLVCHFFSLLFILRLLILISVLFLFTVNTPSFLNRERKVHWFDMLRKEKDDAKYREQLGWNRELLSQWEKIKTTLLKSLNVSFFNFSNSTLFKRS